MVTEVVQSVDQMLVTNDSEPENTPKFTAKVNPPAPTIKSLPRPTSEPTRQLRVYYELDEESLLPRLIRKEPTELPVKPAEATRIRVEASNGQASFAAEALPEVYMSGELNVKEVVDVPEPEEETVLPPENNIVTEDGQTLASIYNKAKNKGISVVQNVKADVTPRVPARTVRVKILKPTSVAKPPLTRDIPAKGVETTRAFVTRAVPQSTKVLADRVPLKRAELTVEAESEPVNFESTALFSEQTVFSARSLVVPVATVLAALVVALMTVTLTTEILVMPPSSQLGFIFQAQDLMNFLGSL
jgi:hypothetical protein